MSKVKIKSTLPHRANSEVTLPEGLGKVVFGQDCIGEVDAEVAQRISQMNLAGFEIVKENKDLGGGDEVEFTEEALMKLTLKDLKELAKKADLDEAEYSKLQKKADLVKYLLEKVNGTGEEDLGGGEGKEGDEDKTDTTNTGTGEGVQE